MGNQLVGIAPSQILPVEHYLTDVPHYEYISSLGSTRFFKVAKARYSEGLSVVKVFVIHDPSLPLKTYNDHIDDIKKRLNGASNCLPFQKTTLSDKAGLLFRQYVKDSLYDRISTRPFLNTIEKKWLAFQLLCALNQSHKLSVCHGDIKSENVMVTSWNWLLLTDFASFKPTYLPEDNPADFSYFFDTSRRRTCYIAPERFLEGFKSNMAGNLDLTSTVVGELKPAMDIFSAGCVIIELFTDGNAPFDLSQLLSYRVGDYSPWKIMESIKDTNIRDLIRSMIQKDPSHRLSAEEYLIQQRGKAFPEYFYTFLKLYLQRFASIPIMPSDDRIHRIKRDMDLIHQKIQDKADSDDCGHVLVVSFVTACLRDLRFQSSKLIALELMSEFSEKLSAEMILDRLVPYMLLLVQDSVCNVRSAALRTLTHCLSKVNSVPRHNANIFPEYILPQLAHLTNDKVVSVRVAYAENIAQLAETALRFLEIVQLSEEGKENLDETDEHVSTYDTDLHALHEAIQQKVVTLLSDPDNIVKQTLLENGITTLCVFFGRQKANDTLLSHMITFLNDKFDWNLRAAFFDSIVGVVAYVGWQSSTILKPLLQQGLSDSEEFVIYKALVAITALTELGLLQKPILNDLLKEIVPCFCHPNVWIRHGAVGFVCAVASTLNIADIHCNILPQIQPFLKQQVMQVEKEVVLLNALANPIPRSVYDYVLRSPDIVKIYETLEERHMIRGLCRPGHQPKYSSVEESIAQLFRKLLSQGMSENDEEKLLAMKDLVTKISHGRTNSNELADFENDMTGKNGGIDLFILGPKITRRHADLLKQDGKDANASNKKSKKKANTTDNIPSNMNEEWKHMFGDEDMAPSKTRGTMSKQKSVSHDSTTDSVAANTITMSALQISVEGSPARKTPASVEKIAIQTRLSNCKTELRNILSEKSDEYMTERAILNALDTSSMWDEKRPPSHWRPKGLLVAHLHEHRAAVNRIRVNKANSHFASCSNDGTVKIWECDRIEGKSITNRSKYTYSKQGGKIKCIDFVDNVSIAAASDNDTIHVIKLDVETSQIHTDLNETINKDEHGHIVDMKSYNIGSQRMISYATVNGHIIGWDIRKPKPAWLLKNHPKLGLITSFDIHTSQSWMVVGTSSGNFIGWDLRFQLPITTITHPTGARIRRVLMHPKEQSQIISSVHGNNEVSIWDMENSSRLRTLWASSAPALSIKQTSSHSSNGVYISNTDNMFMLTAGSDMRVRHWDMTVPEKSFIVAGAANDPVNQTTVTSYRSQYIEGTHVIQEMYSKVKGARNEDIPRRSPDSPPLGHHDTITDISLFQTTQCFIVTSSRDGVVKIWK